MGVLSWRGLVAPKFSAPPSGKTMRQTPKVLEVEERARGPGGADIAGVDNDGVINSEFKP